MAAESLPVGSTQAVLCLLYIFTSMAREGFTLVNSLEYLRRKSSYFHLSQLLQQSRISVS